MTYEYMEPGRRQISERIHSLLPDRRKPLLKNLGKFASIDERVDESVDITDRQKYLTYCEESLTSGWKREVYTPINEQMESMYRLGRHAKQLYMEGRQETKYVYFDAHDQLQGHARDIARQDEVLPELRLDAIRRSVSEPYCRAMLHIAIPPMRRTDAIRIASCWGLPAKIGDDLTDVERDFPKGFLNIPKFYFEKYDVSKSSIEKINLDQEYIIRELSRANKMYIHGESVVEPNLNRRYEDYRKELSLIKEFSRSWFQEAKDKYSVQSEVFDQLVQESRVESEIATN